MTSPSDTRSLTMPATDGTSSIVPGKRVRIIGPSFTCNSEHIGKEAEVIKKYPNSKDYQTSLGVYNAGSLTPLDDEPEAGKGEYAVGEDVWVRGKVQDPKWHRGTVLVDIGPNMSVKVPLSDLRRA